MKALFLTPQLPYPARKGTQLRNLNLIRNLAAEHEIHVLSFVEPQTTADGPSVGRAAMASFCARVETVPVPPHPVGRRLRYLLLSRLPDMAIRLWSAEYATKLSRLLAEERYDLVQAEGIEMAPYMPLVARLFRGRARPKLVFDDHNAEFLLQRRAFELDRWRPMRWPAATYSLLQWLKLRAYERSACRLADRVLAVSEKDRQALLGLDRRLAVAVVPNGVDCDEFAFRGQQPSGNDLLFTGTMDYRPNIDAAVWFATDILPRIQRQTPEARFLVVGRSPAPAVQRLARRPSDGRVVVTGEVADMRPYMADAVVYVVPLRFGGGTRFKVLEAFAAGVPVVSTSFGVDGLDVRHEREVLIADEPTAFAAATVRLLHEPALCRALVEQARAFVAARYDWRAIAPQLVAVYRDMGLC